MDHSSYIRTPPGAKKAILFLHGICSTPRHFDFLIPDLDDNWAVYNMLIEGHGGTVKDFANASMKQWKAQAHRVLDEMSQRYDSILVVGYSMGTMLEVEALPQYPKVRGMLLLNAPMRPWVRLDTALGLLKLSKSKPNPERAKSYKNTVGVAVTPGLLQYIPWIPRFLELLVLCRHCRRHKDNITVPCYVFLGTRDELVSMRSRKYFECNPNVTLRVMEGGGHMYYPEESIAQMHTDLRTLMDLC